MNKQLKIALVLDDYKVVINAGSDSGIQIGQRYLLYTLSHDEISDPDTHESLGYLEIVKGTGKVTHVQEKMATIESDTYKTSTKKITREPSVYFPLRSNSIEEETDREQLSFDSPEIGDFVKRVN